MDGQNADGIMRRNGFSSDDLSVMSVYTRPWPVTSLEMHKGEVSDGSPNQGTPVRPTHYDGSRKVSRCLDFDTPKKRRQCSLQSKRERRKRYRQKKKAIHRFGVEKWELMAQEKLQQRWCERSRTFNAACQADEEDRQLEKEQEETLTLQHNQAVALLQAKRIEMVESVEDDYVQYRSEDDSAGTAPLLLNEVLVPIKEPCSSLSSVNLVHTAQCIEHVTSARIERNQALLYAQQCRDLAEKTQHEKRDLKYKLQTQVEVVRNFWRNQLVEGSSRSGKMLRAALLRK